MADSGESDNEDSPKYWVGPIKPDITPEDSSDSEDKGSGSKMADLDNNPFPAPGNTPILDYDFELNQFYAYRKAWKKQKLSCYK